MAVDGGSTWGALGAELGEVSVTDGDCLVSALVTTWWAVGSLFLSPFTAILRSTGS